MARKSISIEINGGKLKELLTQQGDSLESLADKVGCSRPTLYSWFNTNRISPRQLSAIAKACSLTASEIQAIKPTGELRVFFRTLRDIQVPSETVQRVKTSALEIARLYKTEVPYKAEKSLPVFKSKTPRELAAHIRKVLGLPLIGLTLDQLLSSLEVVGVSVLFLPFESSVVDAKVHAFTAIIKDLKLIFVDTNCFVEEVVWRILHELAHLFSDDGTEVTVAQEKFCDLVATQIVTPEEFFEHNKESLKNALSDRKNHAPEVAKEVASHLSASYRSVILAFERHKIISRGSFAHSYLWKFFHGMKDRNPTVDKLLKPANDDVVEHWVNVFDDRSRIRLLKYFYLVKEGLISGRVSADRAAEVFGVDLPTMLEIKSRWLATLTSPDVLPTSD